nr:unnamed protein product [Digitaria exilis]
MALTRPATNAARRLAARATNSAGSSTHPCHEHARISTRPRPPLPLLTPLAAVASVGVHDDDRRLEVGRRGVLEQLVPDPDVGRVEVVDVVARVLPPPAAPREPLLLLVVVVVVVSSSGSGGGGGGLLLEHVAEARVLDAPAAAVAAAADAAATPDAAATAPWTRPAPAPPRTWRDL